MSAIAHAWSVLCDKVIQDSGTNNISMDALEQVTLQMPPPPPGIKGFVVPVRLELVSLWYRTNPAVGGKCTSRFRLVSPDGEELLNSEYQVDMSSHVRMRSRCQMNSLPVSSGGFYLFIVEQKDEGEREGWREAARLPLQVVVEQPREKSSPQPRT